MQYMPRVICAGPCALRVLQARVRVFSITIPSGLVWITRKAVSGVQTKVWIICSPSQSAGRDVLLVLHPRQARGDGRAGAAGSAEGGDMGVGRNG